MEHCCWSVQMYRGVPVQLQQLSTTRASVLKLRSRVELAFAHILKNTFARRASSSRARIRVHSYVYVQVHAARPSTPPMHMRVAIPLTSWLYPPPPREAPRSSRADSLPACTRSTSHQCTVRGGWERKLRLGGGGGWEGWQQASPTNTCSALTWAAEPRRVHSASGDS